jgi:hypothetical protein
MVERLTAQTRGSRSNPGVTMTMYLARCLGVIVAEEGLREGGCGWTTKSIVTYYSHGLMAGHLKKTFLEYLVYTLRLYL